MAVLPRRIEFSPSSFHGYVSNETRKDEVQPSMKLRSFRVQNYRCIDDSGEAPVEHIKALVGKNESGKTSNLRALHKFNPASPEPYNGPRGQKRVIRDRSAPRRSVWRVGQERLCGTVCCRATARHPDPIPQPQGDLSTSYPAPRCHRQTRRYSLWTRGRRSLEASRCSYQSRDRHR